MRHSAAVNNDFPTCELVPSTMMARAWLMKFASPDCESQTTVLGSGRVPHVRQSVHGPKTDSSNAFTPGATALALVPEKQRRWKGLRPVFIGPRTLGRTWGTRPGSKACGYQARDHFGPALLPSRRRASIPAFSSINRPNNQTKSESRLR
jgi:hypothetical protein